MKFRYLLLVVCLAFAGDGFAAMYKRVESDGSVTYSNEPFKGSKKITLDPLPTVESSGKHKGKKSKTRKNSGKHTRVKPSVQKERDETRRKVLVDELAAEQKLLAEAQQKLKQAKENPHIVVSGGKAFPNVGAQQEEIDAAQKEVERHQKNIEALKTELDSSR